MTREHRQVLLLGPPSDIRSLLTSRGKPLIAVPGLRRLVRIENPSLVQAQDGIFYSSLCPCFFADYAISSVTARSRRLSVSKASSALFCRIHRILVKVEQGFFNRQMTFGHIRLSTASCDGGRTKLSHSGIHGQSD